MYSRLLSDGGGTPVRREWRKLFPEQPFPEF